VYILVIADRLIQIFYKRMFQVLIFVECDCALQITPYIFIYFVCSS
jgi:hypothetical protein